MVGLLAWSLGLVDGWFLCYCVEVYSVMTGFWVGWDLRFGLLWCRFRFLLFRLWVLICGFGLFVVCLHGWLLD